MILRMYFGAKWICWRRCPHKCAAITIDEILFPLCPSVVRGDSRIREETWKWKTQHKGLILPFRKQNTQIGQWFFKDASHQSSTACSFGLPLLDSIAFHFLEEKKKVSYLPPRNSDTVWQLFYCELCPFLPEHSFLFGGFHFMLFNVYFWVHGMWDLSSPTRNWTCTPCIRSVES